MHRHKAREDQQKEESPLGGKSPGLPGGEPPDRLREAESTRGLHLEDIPDHEVPPGPDILHHGIILDLDLGPVEVILEVLRGSTALEERGQARGGAGAPHPGG